MVDFAAPAYRRPIVKIPLASFFRVAAGLFLLLTSLCGRSDRVDLKNVWLVRQGKAQAVIVAPSGAFYGFVASELQRYFEKLTGARLAIESPETARSQPRDVTFILVGGPNVNPMVHDLEGRSPRSNCQSLKPEGYILRNARLAGHNVLITAGNDENGTMYAAYSLLEQYGAVFLITGDILPEQRPNLPVISLDIRREPAFATRGFDVSQIYESRSLMSLADQHRMLDQMAKMKFNFLMFDWMAWEPWLRYDYRGEVKHLGDIAQKESGYMLWNRDFTGYMTYGSHLTSDVSVGKEHFKAAGIYPRVTAPEFQKVENGEQAFEVARNYLKDLIAYAKTRKIKVWLGMDATSSPPNLARYTTITSERPFDPVMGTFTCPANPVSLEINNNRLKSLFETYPDVDGYFLYITESYPVCNNGPEDRSFYDKLRPQYLGEARARAPYTYDIAHDDDTVIDSNSGSVYFIQKLVELRDQIAPGKKLGIAGIGRLYLWPFIDKLFPSDMPFSDFESRAIWTPAGVPMATFGEMKSGRPNLLINRNDDDSSMLGMQFNVNLYYKDQVLAGALKYHLAGFATQVNRQRGTEQNTSYMSQGEWEPNLTPQEFYKRYTQLIFGDHALDHMLKAFDTLERNEELLGWTGRENFGCCGSLAELRTAYQYSQQPNPFDGPKFSGWDWYISHIHDQINFFSKSTRLLDQALSELRAAQPLAENKSQSELAYLINRTEAYRMHLSTLILWDQAYIDLNRDFQMDRLKDREAFVQQLDSTLEKFKQVRQHAREMAEKWSEIIDNPSDLGVLYRINVFMVTGSDLTEQLIENIDNFHHGRDYMRQVDFSKVAVSFPRIDAVMTAQ